MNIRHNYLLRAVCSAALIPAPIGRSLARGQAVILRGKTNDLIPVPEERFDLLQYNSIAQALAQADGGMPAFMMGKTILSPSAADLIIGDKNKNSN